MSVGIAKRERLVDTSKRLDQSLSADKRAGKDSEDDTSHRLKILKQAVSSVSVFT